MEERKTKRKKEKRKGKKKEKISSILLLSSTFVNYTSDYVRRLRWGFVCDAMS